MFGFIFNSGIKLMVNNHVTIALPNKFDAKLAGLEEKHAAKMNEAAVSQEDKVIGIAAANTVFEFAIDTKIDKVAIANKQKITEPFVAIAKLGAFRYCFSLCITSEKFYL